MARRIDCSKVNAIDLRLLKQTLTYQKRKSRFGQQPPLECMLKEGSIYYVPFDSARIIDSRYPQTEASEFAKHEVKLEEYQHCDFTYIGRLREDKDQPAIIAEAIACLDEGNSVLINVPPGRGKTAMSVYLMAHLKQRTIINVNLGPLIGQWVTTLMRDTSITSEQIAIISGDSKDVITEQTQVAICMPGSFRRVPDFYRQSTGLVIVDEIHKYINKTGMKAMLSVCPRYLIGCTATIERSDGAHCMLRNFFAKRIVKRELDRPYKVIEVRTGIIPVRDKRKQKDNSDYNEVIDGLLHHELRNKIIIDVLQRIKQRPVIILTKLVFHVHILRELAEAAGFVTDYMCRKKGTYEDCDVIIGTFAKIGAGFDEENCCVNYKGTPSANIILTCIQPDDSNLFQNIGRIGRCKEPTVYQLVDRDNTLLRHWNKNYKWYLRHKCPVTHVDYSDRVL